MKFGLLLLLVIGCLLLPRVPMAGGKRETTNRPIPAFEMETSVVQKPASNDDALSTATALALIAVAGVTFLAWRQRKR